MNPNLKPVRKVAYGSLSGGVILVVSYLLVHFVFHKQLTAEEQVLIVGIVPFVVGWFVAYMTKHDPKLLAEIETVVPEVEDVTKTL